MVAYAEPVGNLHVVIDIQYGQPKTSYEVFLVAGPAHSKATGFRVIGTLQTDATGAGKGAFSVLHATLLSTPYGPGYRTDHIDLLKSPGDESGGCLTAGAINYFVSSEKVHLPIPPGLKLVETLKGTAVTGDPLFRKN
jgi:hypothetical protein